MNERYFITRQGLSDLFHGLAGSGKRILAPVRSGERVTFQEVTAYDQVDNDCIITTVSAKEALLPRCEEITRWEREGKDVRMVDERNPAVPTVVYGIRPCDARALATLDAVYNWDYKDVFYQSKRDATAFIAVSCAKSDEFCFCTSTGGGPGDTAGSDILLTPMEGDTLLVEVLTEKGKAIIAENAALFTETGPVEKEKYLASVESKFSADDIREKLQAAFDSELWADQALRCLGCGACAFVCPACTCFDIQDEVRGSTGVRLRCWDACGLSHFTMHTSGHNPRESQGQRFRQRIMHKFSYEPKRLDVSGCVGCGRCSRACPADMNILEHLMDIAGVK